MENQEPYAQPSTLKLIERFQELETHTRNMIFKNKMPAIVEWPVQDEKLLWKAVWKQLLLPYNVFGKQQLVVPIIVQIGILALWIFLLEIWFGLGNNILRTELGIPELNPSPNSTLPNNPILYGLLIFVVILVTLLPLVTFYQMWWYFFRCKTKLLYKMTWLAGFIYIALQYVGKVDLVSKLPTILSQSQNSVMVFFACYFLIAAGVVLYFTMSEFVRSFMETIAGIGVGLLRTSNPIPYRIINTLINEPIKSEKNEWFLAKLGRDEITTIRTWSEKNLDINEKKTVPTILMLTLLGLLINITSLQNIAGQLLETLTSLITKFFVPFASNLTLAEYVGGFLAAVLLMLFAMNYADNFRNFAVQGAITQACVIAEHYASNNNNEVEAAHVRAPSLLNFLRDWLIYSLIQEKSTKNQNVT